MIISLNDSLGLWFPTDHLASWIPHRSGGEFKLSFILQHAIELKGLNFKNDKYILNISTVDAQPHYYVISIRRRHNNIKGGPWISEILYFLQSSYKGHEITYANHFANSILGNDAKELIGVDWLIM